jgi:hypothetical protein
LECAFGAGDFPQRYIAKSIISRLLRAQALSEPGSLLITSGKRMKYSKYIQKADPLRDGETGSSPNLGPPPCALEMAAISAYTAV